MARGQTSLQFHEPLRWNGNSVVCVPIPGERTCICLQILKGGVAFVGCSEGNLTLDSAVSKIRQGGRKKELYKLAWLFSSWI